MQIYVKYIFLFIIAVFFSENLLSIPYSSGKKFYIAFPSNYYPDAEKKLYITSNITSTVNVYMPSPIFNNNYTVYAYQTTEVNLPQNSELKVSDSLSYTTIRVTSDNDIAVYGINKRLTVTDAFLALPVESLGTEYIIQSYPSSLTENPSTGGSQFAVVGTKDNTYVTITLPINTGPYFAGVPYSVTLQTGQAYYLKATGLPGNDLSGTKISSNYPVAVFGSHQCANVPDNELFCDYLIEQLPPVTSWGKEFIIVPLAGRKNGDTYRFLASEDNCDIYLDGLKITTLNKNEIYEAIIDGPGYISSTGRILLTQYANGVSYDNPTNDIGDPFMMIIPPVEQFLSSYTIYSPDIGTPVTLTSNFLNLIVNKSDKSNIKVDATPVPSFIFTDLSYGDFSVARVSVNTGTHNITGELPFLVLVYGFNWRESYGYPAGTALYDFVSSPTPTITNTITATITKTLTPTKTSTITKTMTYDNTFTITETLTITKTPSITKTQTEEFTKTNTPTITRTLTKTITPTNSITATITLTITNTFTITITQTITKTLTETPTFTITESATLTMTPSITHTPLPPTVTMTQTPSEPELEIKITGNFPNPFNKGTFIVFWLSKEAEIDLKIFTVSGEIVNEKAKLNGIYGINKFYWDGKNKFNREVASGVFIYKIRANDEKKEVIKWGKLICVR